jgi:molybdopterin-guanine dinucleotide biosynthesis protein A
MSVSLESKNAPFSCAILIGGQSRRMGENKVLMPLAGLPMTQWVIDAVRPLSNDVFLVANQPDLYQSFGLPCYQDVKPHHGALGGLYTALRYARWPWVFVVAGDMPLLNPAVIRWMSGFRPETQVVVPQLGPHTEALHAFYHRTCLPAIEARLAEKRLKMTGFYPAVHVTPLSQAHILAVTPTLDFLTNVNTPAHWEQAAQQLTERAKADQNPSA